MESVNKRLQENKTTISEVRALFDTVMTHYPSTSNRLSATADTVEFPAFESALVNIKENNAQSLKEEERKSVEHL